MLLHETGIQDQAGTLGASLRDKVTFYEVKVK
jgi:hypothetical protein